MSTVVFTRNLTNPSRCCHLSKRRHHGDIQTYPASKLPITSVILPRARTSAARLRRWKPTPRPSLTNSATPTFYFRRIVLGGLRIELVGAIGGHGQGEIPVLFSRCAGSIAGRLRQLPAIGNRNTLPDSNTFGSFTLPQFFSQLGQAAAFANVGRPYRLFALFGHWTRIQTNFVCTISDS